MTTTKIQRVLQPGRCFWDGSNLNDLRALLGEDRIDPVPEEPGHVLINTGDLTGPWVRIPPGTIVSVLPGGKIVMTKPDSPESGTSVFGSGKSPSRDASPPAREGDSGPPGVEDLLEIAERLFGDVRETLKERSVEYGSGGDDVLHNLRAIEVATRSEISTEIGILARMYDKMARIASLLRKHPNGVNRDLVTDAIRDLVGYAVLMALSLEWGARSRFLSRED